MQLRRVHIASSRFFTARWECTRTCVGVFRTTSAACAGVQNGCAAGRGQPDRNREITLGVITVRRYHRRVIRSWADDEAEKLFNRQRSRKLPPDIQRVALRKLLMVDAATTLEDLRIPPSNHLEKLKGDREGQWSIRINDQWRVCFVWQDGNAHDVEIVDYH